MTPAPNVNSKTKQASPAGTPLGEMKKYPTMSNISDIGSTDQATDVSDVSDASPNVSPKSKQASPAGTPLGRIIKANGVESVFINRTLPERGGVSS